MYLSIHITAVIGRHISDIFEPHLKHTFLSDELTAVGVQSTVDWHKLVKLTRRLLQLHSQLLDLLHSNQYTTFKLSFNDSSHDDSTVNIVSGIIIIIIIIIIITFFTSMNYKH